MLNKTFMKQISIHSALQNNSEWGFFIACMLIYSFHRVSEVVSQLVSSKIVKVHQNTPDSVRHEVI